MLEIACGDRTILDIASTIVELEPIELEGYEHSIGAGPRELFGFGYEYTVRRAGVVHVAAGEYDRFKVRLGDELLHDAALLRRVLGLYKTCKAALTSTFTRNVFNGTLTLQTLWRQHMLLMTFTSVNWLLEPRELVADVARALGAEKVYDQLATLLSTAVEAPHFIEIELDRISTYLRICAGDVAAAREHALHYGHWYEMMFWKAPFESPTHAMREIRAAFDDVPDALRRQARLLAGQGASQRKREDWRAYVLLQSELPEKEMRRICLAAEWLQLACDAEEFRHKMQRNVMRVLRDEAIRLGLGPGEVTSRALDLRSCTSAALDGTGAAVSR